MAKGNDTDRYVEPNKERGGWDVRKENADRASAHTGTKKEAVDRARELSATKAAAKSASPTRRAS